MSDLNNNEPIYKRHKHPHLAFLSIIVLLALILCGIVIYMYDKYYVKTVTSKTTSETDTETKTGIYGSLFGSAKSPSTYSSSNKKLDCKCTVIDDNANNANDTNNDNANNTTNTNNKYVDEVENFSIVGDNSDPSSFYKNASKKTHAVNSENDIYYASNVTDYDLFSKADDVGKIPLGHNNDVVLAYNSIFNDSPAYKN